MADETLSACIAEIKAHPGEFYVYILSRPCGTPFYVGCGAATAGRRLHRIGDHEREAARGEKSLKCSLIRKIARHGKAVRYRIDSWHAAAEAMFAREVALIAEIGRRDLRRGPLANGNDGGTGQLNPSAKARAAISGPRVTWTEDARKPWREKIRATWSKPEYREMIRQRNSRVWADPAVVAKLSASLKKFNAANPAVVERNRALLAKYKADPEVEARRVAAMKREDVRQAIAARQRANWADPEYRARLTASMRARQSSPERREHNSAVRKVWWTPERRAAQAERARQQQAKRRREG